mgnify:CR=1 FL=1
MTQEKIEIMKKTKSKEELSDIKPGIYKLENKDDGIYMLLASGSVLNLKPELVIEALCKYSGLVYNRYDYMVHRLETYMGERNNLQSLITAGKRF